MGVLFTTDAYCGGFLNEMSGAEANGIVNGIIKLLILLVINLLIISFASIRPTIHCTSGPL